MSKIEWCDITLNPIAGKCPHGCEYCYAEAMRRRFHWSEAMTFKPEVIEKMLKLRNPRAIFWGSVFDLFADTVPTEWLNQIFEACNSPEGLKHSHIFLTKNPKRYAEFAHYKNHENIFFGVSTTGRFGFRTTFTSLDFVSCEPYIDRVINYNDDISCGMFSHIIIGGLTGRGNDPYKKIDYNSVEYLCKIAFETGKNIFIKNNLIEYAPLRPHISKMRNLPWQLHTKNPVEVRP